MSSNNLCAIENVLDRTHGLEWHRLHSEREDICEALIKESVSGFGSGPAHEEMSEEDAARTENWHKELLQARLNKIDDALDRLTSGSYGNCCKCGRWIEDTKLDFDPAVAFCVECWQRQQNHTSTQPLNADNRETRRPISRQSDVLDDLTNLNTSPASVSLGKLEPFDTIWLQTHNSDYRILLLDPRSGRALVVGGRYFGEPVEAIVNGSTLDGYTLWGAWIGVGLRMSMWVEDRLVSTSPVQSVRVERHIPLETASMRTNNSTGVGRSKASIHDHNQANTLPN